MDISEVNTTKKIVCLGGGIGTVNLIKGLKTYFKNISVVVSMADEGGSSGRLRKLYNIFPPGDLVSCMAATADSKDSVISQLLTYRFPGNRYGREHHLGGHKLGNLLMVALRDITGDFDSAIAALQKMFNIEGTFLPATSENITISAKTTEGQMVSGEEAIDLGKYPGKRILERVFIHPENPRVSPKVIQTIKEADIIVAGPGDLYTTILPVLIVPAIAQALQESVATKIYVANVANKPFETKGYSTQNFIEAIAKHLNSFPFTKVITNNNFNIEIPKEYKYDYVKKSPSLLDSSIELIERDLVEESFPLYHSSSKLAKAINEAV